MSAEVSANPVEVIAYAVTGVAALLGLSSLLMPVARRIAMPYTVLVALLGGLVGALLASAPAMGHVAQQTAAVFADAEIPSEALLYLFLPPLLFAAGLAMDFRRLMDDIWAVLLMAIVAVVLCCFVVGLALVPFLVPQGAGETDWLPLVLVALLIGAVVAPTDTAAILSIFKDIGAPRRLSTIVEGESLFNDAAAIALVVVLIGALSGDTLGVAGAGADFARALGGGLLLGYVSGMVAAVLAQFARGFVIAETTVSLALAYVVFTAAQLLFGVSGVIAVVAAAIAFGARARTRLTPGSWDAMQALWRQLDFWATTLIFVFAAMTVPDVLAQLHWTDLGVVAAVYVAALVARSIVVFGVMPLLVRLGLTEPFSLSYRFALAWGGVRGAVTIVLALFVAEDEAVHVLGDETARLILVAAFGYTLLTLFVNAPTLRLLMRVLRLDALDPRERMVRDRVMALSRRRVAEGAARAAAELGLERDIDTEVFSAETTLSHDERVQVGLLALVNREAELAMDALERGVIDREIAEIALAHTGRMYDFTRSDGAAGYARAWAENQRLTGRFRMALWLHRTFGLRAPLAREIALRFELLLGKDRILASLIEYAGTQLPHVIGTEASAEVAGQLDRRRTTMRGAMAALEKQYPAYARMVRELLVERIALALEESEYRVQRGQGLISEEIYEDLEADRRRRVRSLSDRPPLDLGLEITAMIGKVPMFQGLSDTVITAIAKLLRPELAVQGEHVIRAGTIGREMYFIVSGAVEVIVPGEPVRLGEGEFFGEVALLTSRPRNADVVAVSYCELLVLRRREFDALPVQEPSLKEQIERSAASRSGAAASVGD
jgi:CPA1 family monovalent cation:H+ antiporter